jgi:hypothetical protein
MQLTFKEINEKHHSICGAFLFYNLGKNRFKRYVILGANDDGVRIMARKKQNING